MRETTRGLMLTFKADRLKVLTFPSGASSVSTTIPTVTNNMADPDETFRVDIIASELPDGFAVGDQSSATVTILDRDRSAQLEADCGDDYTSANCIPVLNFELLTKEISESDLPARTNLETRFDDALTIRLTSNRTFTSNAVIINFENKKGDRISSSLQSAIKPNVSFTANEPKDIKFGFNFLNAKNNNKDRPDGQILVVPSTSTDGATVQFNENDMLFWLRDEQDTRVLLQNASNTNLDYQDNSQENHFYFGFF